jgi:uncharacterized protein with NRDE domain
MCTLLFRYRPDDRYPLAILSNRDEAYNRPSGDWEWRGDVPRYFAPVDLKAGGTWIGLNESGVVVALTNIYPGRKDPEFRSRGALVVDLLHLEEAERIPAVLRANLDNRRYNNFNLLVADRASAYLFTWKGRNLKQHDLAAGVYEVGNRPYRGGTLADDLSDNEDWLAQHASRLMEHPSVCKHGPGYGTRCSHKILIHGEVPSSSLIWHLDGHPCRGIYRLILGSDS